MGKSKKTSDATIPQLKESMEAGFWAKRAFDHLERIVSEVPSKGLVTRDGHSEFIDVDPPEIVEVRYDELIEIVRGWAEYKAANGSLGLGEVYGLEGGHQGAHGGLGRLSKKARITKAARYRDQLLDTTNLNVREINILAIERFGLNMTLRTFERAIAKESSGHVRKAIRRALRK